MPDWQERIDRETDPAIRVEHELRYRAAAPVIAESAVWCDLGCGTGLAAAGAIGRYDGRAVLVDASADALAEAQRRIEADEVVAVRADLTDVEDLQRVRTALLEQNGETRCITCFEVIEHLSNFVPAIDLLTRLAEDEAFTVFLSVPNDAFWSIENPHHTTMWGAGSLEELRGLLPENHVLAHQASLQGSFIAPLGGNGNATTHDLTTRTTPDTPPTHFLLALGPSAPHLTPTAAVAQADPNQRRTWERQRESNVAYYQSLEGVIEARDAEIVALKQQVGVRSVKRNVMQRLRESRLALRDLVRRT